MARLLERSPERRGRSMPGLRRRRISEGLLGKVEVDCRLRA